MLDTLARRIDLMASGVKIAHNGSLGTDGKRLASNALSPEIADHPAICRLCAGVALGFSRIASGEQNYPIPAGVDLAGFGSVVIWCERFGVLISPATLTPVGS